MSALSEPRAAVAKAKALLPSLTPSGIGVDRDGDFDLEQVATAIAFLRLCRPASRPRLSSYGLKHNAEHWGRVSGMEPYVSNGALIAAAVYLDFRVANAIDDINVLVGVNRRDVERLDPLSEYSRREWGRRA